MKIDNFYKSKNYDVFTYRRIRRAIGYLGISLPLVLVVLSLFDFFNTDIQPSISHYYYTNLRDIFSGTLCAVGVFLIRYKGHGNKILWKDDKVLTNCAGVMALGVAFVPTNPAILSQKIYTLIPYMDSWLGWLHYAFAAGLFLIFSLLAINVFTIGQKIEEGGRESIFNENKIYKFCGWSILIFIAMVPVSAQYRLFPYSTLVFETLSLIVFGIAWLIKGRALGDKGAIGRKVYKEHNAVSTEKVVEGMDKS